MRDHFGSSKPLENNTAYGYVSHLTANNAINSTFFSAVEDAYVAMHSQRNGSYVGLIAAVATIIVIAVTRWMCWGNSKTRNKQIN